MAWLVSLVSGAQCVRALSHLGYVVARTRGSHARLTCDGRSPVTVPLHDELDRGTLRAILRSVEVDADEFLELLDR
jgi:predicted RNA binding protein YcfA (HicA-like mRNA interferase family)